jgi:DNA topoisomerase-1
MKKLGEEQMKKNALYLFLQCAKSPIKCMKIECEENIISEKENSHYTEAGLIRDLEEYNIGRPSTFSIILQNIQERNYVVKKDLEGKKIKCIDLVLHLGQIELVEKERIIGKEKNKLVLQELGKMVIEELIPTFNDLFSYDYTKKMEMELDKISKYDDNLELSNIICSECENTIKKNAKQWKIEMKQKYKIDDDHELIFTKTGAVIMYNNSEYKRIRSNMKLDFNKLRNKEYNLEDLLEIPNEYLGEYEGHPLFLKNGPYGIYVTWGGDKKENLENFIKKEKKIENITLEDIIQYLQKKTNNENKKTQNANILRILNERISIRKGKYGAYIYYSLNLKEKEKKPHFYNLKLFPGNYLICEQNEILEWLENTYGII